MKVGSAIGESKKIDQATNMSSKGFFTCVCIEVSVTKPLLAKFILRNIIRTIEYEGFHLVCYKCTVVGHQKEECMKDGAGHDEVTQVTEERCILKKEKTNKGKKWRLRRRKKEGKA